MGMIADRNNKKSGRTAWREFMPGARFLLRYVNPQERDKIIASVSYSAYDPESGERKDKINDEKFAKKVRHELIVMDWEITGTALRSLIDLTEYPAADALVPFDLDDLEVLVVRAEGFSGWLIEKMRHLAGFVATEETARKNASAPSSDHNSASAEH